MSAGNRSDEMSANAEQRRFNWIHFYCDAMRWAVVNELVDGHYAVSVYALYYPSDLQQGWTSKLQQHCTTLRPKCTTRRGGDTPVKIR